MWTDSVCGNVYEREGSNSAAWHAATHGSILELFFFFFPVLNANFRGELQQYEIPLCTWKPLRSALAFRCQSTWNLTGAVFAVFSGTFKGEVTLYPTPPVSLEVDTRKHTNSFDAVTHMQESSPQKRFLVGCCSPFMPLAEHLTALRAWCKQCLPRR